jgi:hypothetical protein
MNPTAILAAALCAFGCQGEIKAEPSAEAAVTPPQAQSRRIFFIGHSLQSDIPDMVLAMGKSADRSFAWQEQFILGSPLRWQWDQPKRGSEGFEPTYQAVYDKGITAQTTDLVLTDSVPRGGDELVRESIDYLGRFARFAREKSPNVRVWYYETWHCIESGTAKGCEYDTMSPTRSLTWRKRLDADRAMWLKIAKEAAPNIRVIPAGSALGLLSDAIDRGEVPGFKSARDLFDDDIHVNPYGKLFVAYVHHAALTGQSPVGLPFKVPDRWGRSYWNTPNWAGKQWPEPSPAAVKRMQELAWEAVQKWPTEAAKG